MKHTVEETADGVVVAFDGDVDLQTSPDARKVLLESVSPGKHVVVDLSKVGYIDSSGIASLVEALQRSKKHDGRLSLAAVSDPALRVLKLARLDKVFPIFATAEEAAKETG